MFLKKNFLDLFPILFHPIISLTSPGQHRVTLLVEVYKQEVIQVDRIFFFSLFFLNPGVNVKSGKNKALITFSKAKYEAFFSMPTPHACTSPNKNH